MHDAVCLFAAFGQDTARNNSLILQTPEDLAYHAKWCLKYAQLNHQALREIAQERDRYFGGRLGEEFVQVTTKRRLFVRPHDQQSDCSLCLHM